MQVRWRKRHFRLLLVQQVRVSAAKVAWLNADCACARARVLAQLAALDAHIVELRQAFLKGSGANALETVVLGDSIAPRRRTACRERGVERRVAGSAAQRPNRRVGAQR
jgi:hypothetical protein